MFLKIGPGMFLISGAVSLCLITLFLMMLYRIVPEIVKENRTRVARSIALVYIVFNALFFLNLIPPLPLSMKDAGVYHSVIHKPNGTYELSGEVLTWYEEYFNYHVIFHHAPGDTVYVYTSIFAPDNLSTTIEYQWQKYDESTRSWVTTDTLRFPIIGGRDAGYEAYTLKDDVTMGAWRVNVITSYGQLIGRVAFTVADVTTPALLVVSTK